MQDSNISIHDLVSDSDPEELFELLDLLGEGAYGSVYKALEKNTGELYAVKIVATSGEIDSLKREIVILKECQSEYVVKYYGSYFKNNYLWLIMEYCASGSVIDIIRITKRNLNEFEIASILHGTLKGLEYLHDNKKIHRDIKGGNILLDHRGNAKLTDFGVSTQLMNTLADKDTVIGTPFWMSPEIISKSKYNKKTDIWSLGITCIELAEGEPPFSHIHPVRAMFVIKKNPPSGLTNPSQWSTEFNDFISQCLMVEPDQRPQTKDLLQHPFILNKNKGRAILSELVMDSIDQIEKHRIQETSKYRERNNTLKMDVYQQNETGTLIEYKTLMQNDNLLNKEIYYMNENDKIRIVKNETGTMMYCDDIENITSDEVSIMMYNKNNKYEKNNKSTKNISDFEDDEQIDSGTMIVNDLALQPTKYDFVDYVKNIKDTCQIQNIKEKDKSNDQISKEQQQKEQLRKEMLDKIPKELKGMSLSNIQNKKIKLTKDLQMEIQVIQERYQERIDACDIAIKILQENQFENIQEQNQQSNYIQNNCLQNQKNTNSQLNINQNLQAQQNQIQQNHQLNKYQIINDKQVFNHGYFVQDEYFSKSSNVQNSDQIKQNKIKDIVEIHDSSFNRIKDQNILIQDEQFNQNKFSQEKNKSQPLTNKNPKTDLLLKYDLQKYDQFYPIKKEEYNYLNIQKNYQNEINYIYINDDEMKATNSKVDEKQFQNNLDILNSEKYIKQISDKIAQQLQNQEQDYTKLDLVMDNVTKSPIQIGPPTSQILKQNFSEIKQQSPQIPFSLAPQPNFASKLKTNQIGTTKYQNDYKFDIIKQELQDNIKSDKLKFDNYDKLDKSSNNKYESIKYENKFDNAKFQNNKFENSNYESKYSNQKVQNLQKFEQNKYSDLKISNKQDNILHISVNPALKKSDTSKFQSNSNSTLNFASQFDKKKKKDSKIKPNELQGYQRTKPTGIIGDYIISSNGYKSPLSFENALKKNF